MELKKAKPINLSLTLTVTKPVIISFNKDAIDIAQKFEKVFMEFVREHKELSIQYSKRIGDAINTVLEDIYNRKINPLVLLHILIRQMLALIDAMSLYLLSITCRDRCDEDIEGVVNLIYEITISELVAFYEEVKHNVKKRYASQTKSYNVSSYI